jgi:DNA polymerase-3 subunit alpha
MVDRGHKDPKEYKKAADFAAKMVGIFGDDFYIELQNHGFDAQLKYIPKAMDIARQVGANIVVTQDVHYSKPSDWQFQDVLFCIGKKQKYDDATRRHACKEMYVKSRKQMEAMFEGLGVPQVAFVNTLNIMHKVQDYKLQPEHFLLPSVLGSEQRSKEELKRLCREGWAIKITERVHGNVALKEVYSRRVQEELAVINSMGFTDYFLIVRDFIDWAWKHGVRVGPGRGSAAGCLVSYLIGITDIDPITYGLLFERFLVPGRPTMPDIDVDVSDRDAVICYLEEKYGKDRVAPIINRTTASAKAALGKVASILGHFQLGQDLSKLITKTRGETPSFKDALKEIPALRTAKEQNPLLFQLAEGLEGSTLHVAGHASGVVVSPCPISDIVPLYHSHDKAYTAYDGDSISYMKLVKLDILGVDILKIIDQTLAMIKSRHNKSIAIDAIPLDDKLTWDLICSAKTTGVFQFESQLMTGLIKQIKPRNLEDLSAINALGRPGVLDSPGLISSYIRRKDGKEQIKYAHPALEPILKDTYGYMVYQEQMMRICSDIASMNPIQVDKFRKGCSKKDPKILEEMRGVFLEGCTKNKFPKEFATYMFEQILLWAGYGFNKSHAIAYAYVAYQCAWLKAHYLLEFLVSSMNVMVDSRAKLEDIVKFVADAVAMGITIVPPSVVKSYSKFMISETEMDSNGVPFVYYSLGAIKDVSTDATEVWLRERPFKSLDDAILKAVRTKYTIKNLEVLAKVGAFDELAKNRVHVQTTLEDRVKKARNAVARDKRRIEKLKNQNNLDLALDMMTVPSDIRFDYGDTAELAKVPVADKRGHTVQENLVTNQMEYLGVPVSGSLLDNYQEQIRAKADMLTSYFVNESKDGDAARVAGMITSIRKKADKNGRQMAFLTLSDGRTEARVLVFSSIFSRYSETTWRVGKTLIIAGRKDKDSLIAKDVTFLRKERSDPSERETEEAEEADG